MGSALLDASNKRHWELIQQTEGGTAWLLKHFEDYASALAQNMRQTYLSPFTIVTPNIGEGTGMGTGMGVCPRVGGCWWGGGAQRHVHTWGHGHVCAQGCGSGDTCAPGDMGMCVPWGCEPRCAQAWGHVCTQGHACAPGHGHAHTCGHDHCVPVTCAQGACVCLGTPAELGTWMCAHLGV